MGSFAAAVALILSVLLSSSPAAVSRPVALGTITPNFTASYFTNIDNSGAFLSSPNNSFQAKITRWSPEPKTGSFYFVIIHVSSNTIVWSANRNQPVSQSSELRFSRNGLVLYDDSGRPVWSTPGNISTASAMVLSESGNLGLIDSGNGSLWESFDYPTDVIVPGQNLTVGKSLVSSVSDQDLSEGSKSYRLALSNNDAMLQWNGMNYWKMSMETKAFKDTNFRVEYMMVNFSGAYLMAKNGESIVLRIIFNNFDDSSDDSNFLMMKLDYKGVLNVVRISTVGGSSVEVLKSPSDPCRIPYICRSLGVCTNGGSCQCAPSFHLDGGLSNGDCVPTDGSLSLPGSCNGSLTNETMIKYISLREDLDYALNDFSDPVMINVSLLECERLCSMNCSCTGIFYSEKSRSCYVIWEYLGTLVIRSSTTRDGSRMGYVKAIVGKSQRGDKKRRFPVLAAVLLPLGLVIAIVVAGFVWLKRRRRASWARNSISKSGREHSASSREGEEFVSIPGLPVRFDYDELVMATENFKTRVGSGGFGIVYKGTLHDGTDVAVKKITCLGSEGKREFLTEIAVIGKIHHVNLVRLKGFCSQRQRFLVYEYMNRGSMEGALFHDNPILEWDERYKIALGTARGLAYLHTGCDHKIIHCDVKPENILLNDKSQVKISDFGLSKLLSPEQSGLFTTMRGTRGYLAPEWLTSTAISDKTDVYSYGMVLLELIRGQRNSSLQTQSNTSTTDTDNENNNPQHSNSRSSPSSASTRRPVYFPLLALEMHEQKRYLDLIDPRLKGRVEGKDEVESLVRIALCCVQEEPNLRPSMLNVVGMLEGAMPVGEPKMEALNFLRFYGRRATLEQNEQHEAMLYMSYLSAQQISGPR